VYCNKCICQYRLSFKWRSVHYFFTKIRKSLVVKYGINIFMWGSILNPQLNLIVLITETLTGSKQAAKQSLKHFQREAQDEHGWSHADHAQSPKKKNTMFFFVFLLVALCFNKYWGKVKLNLLWINIHTSVRFSDHQHLLLVYWLH